MTSATDPFDRVLAVIDRYLSGELSFDAAADALDPILHALADQQERLWRERMRLPGDPIRIKKPSLQDWQDPHTYRAEVITPTIFAPGRPQDEERARALFHEAWRRTFGSPP